MKKDYLYTWQTMNIILFVLGILIVWFASHNWIAILGTIVASVHISAPADFIERAKKIYDERMLKN